MPGTNRGLHLGRVVSLVGLVSYIGLGHDKQHLRAVGSHLRSALELPNVSQRHV